MNKPDAPDARKVAETALDLFVYAPVGLALEARSLLPKLAQRGRNQIVLARFGARFARQRAEAEAERLLQQLQAVIENDPVAPDSAQWEPVPAAEPEDPAGSTAPVDGLDEVVAPSSTPTPKRAARKSTARKATSRKPAVGKKPARKVADKKPANAAGSANRQRRAKSSDALPISGYDTLSASQVVPRLAAMTPAELETIRAYEASHRGRRTILSRVAQLQP